jgi:hypothetical protein
MNRHSSRRGKIINVFDYQVRVSSEEGRLFDEASPAVEGGVSFLYHHALPIKLGQARIERVFGEEDLMFSISDLFSPKGAILPSVRRLMSWVKTRLDEGAHVVFDRGAPIPVEKYLEAIKSFPEVFGHERTRVVAYGDPRSRPNTLRLLEEISKSADPVKVLPVDHLHLDYSHQLDDFDHLYREADSIALHSGGRGLGLSRARWRSALDKCHEHGTGFHALGLRHLSSQSFAHEALPLLRSVDSSDAILKRRFGLTSLCVRVKVGDLVLPILRDYELYNMNGRPISLRGRGPRLPMNSVQRDYWRKLTGALAEKSGLELNQPSSLATSLVVVHEVRRYVEEMSQVSQADFIGNLAEIAKSEELNRASSTVPSSVPSQICPSLPSSGARIDLDLPRFITKAKDDPKTPAKPSERRTGSDVNERGSASSADGEMKFSPATETALRNMVREHNEKTESESRKVSLGMLKAVFRRGSGAFSRSHRPSVSSRSQWAFARVRAFLKLVLTGERKATYTTDLDLLPEGHPQKSEPKDKIEKARFHLFPSSGLPTPTEGTFSIAVCEKGADWDLWEGFLRDHSDLFDLVVPPTSDLSEVSEALISKSIEIAGDKVVPMVDVSLEGVAEALDESDIEVLFLDFTNATRSSVRSDLKKVASAKGISLFAFGPRALETLHRDAIVKGILTTADEALAERHLGLDFQIDEGGSPVLKVVRHDLGQGPFERSGLDLSTDEVISRSKEALDLFSSAHSVLGGEVFPRLQRKSLFDEEVDLGRVPVVKGESFDWIRAKSFPQLMSGAVDQMIEEGGLRSYDGTSEGLRLSAVLKAEGGRAVLDVPTPSDVPSDPEGLLSFHEALHRMEHSILLDKPFGGWSWDRLVEAHSAISERMNGLGLIHPPKDHSPLDESSRTFVDDLPSEEVRKGALNGLDDQTLLRGIGNPREAPSWVSEGLGWERMDSLRVQWDLMNGSERAEIEKARRPRQLAFRARHAGSWSLHSVHQGNANDLVLTVKRDGASESHVFPLPASGELITSVSKAKSFLKDQGIENPLRDLEMITARAVGRAVPSSFMDLHGVSSAFGYGGKAGTPTIFNLIEKGSVLSSKEDDAIGWALQLQSADGVFEVLCRPLRCSPEIIKARDVLHEHFENPDLQKIVDQLPDLKREKGTLHLALLREVVPEAPEDEETSVSKRFIEIAKADEARRTVMGIVLEPEKADAQGDIYSSDVIRESAYSFLRDFNRSTELGLMHKSFGDVGLSLVESFIAPFDMSFGDREIREGSWLMTMRVDDDTLWEGVKEGRLTGFSIGGVANSVLISQP